MESFLFLLHCLHLGIFITGKKSYRDAPVPCPCPTTHAASWFSFPVCFIFICCIFNISQYFKARPALWETPSPNALPSPPKKQRKTLALGSWGGALGTGLQERSAPLFHSFLLMYAFESKGSGTIKMHSDLRNEKLYKSFVLESNKIISSPKSNCGGECTSLLGELCDQYCYQMGRLLSSMDKLMGSVGHDI